MTAFYLRKPNIPQAWLARGSVDPSGESLVARPQDSGHF